MTIYYVKHFKLYYAGVRNDVITFANDRRDAVGFHDRQAAVDKLKELGEEHGEIEERTL